MTLICILRGHHVSPKIVIVDDGVSPGGSLNMDDAGENSLGPDLFSHGTPVPSHISVVDDNVSSDGNLNTDDSLAIGEFSTPHYPLPLAPSPISLRRVKVLSLEILV